MARKKKEETQKVPDPGRDTEGKFVVGHQLSVGNNGGVESKYKEEYATQAYNYCLLGATDKQLADFFNVCEATINNWKNDHPKFLESLRAGKEVADMAVAGSLFQNCLGAVITREKEVKVKAIDPETLKIIENVEVVKLQEQVPPDTNAIKFWLTNRQKANWKNNSDITTDGEKIVGSIPLVMDDGRSYEDLKNELKPEEEE